MTAHTMTLADLQGRLTLTVPEAGALLSLGRDAAYDAVERGDIEALRYGRRLVVPTRPLLRQLGWSDDLIARALGITPESTGAAPGSATPDQIRDLAQDNGEPHDHTDPAA